MVLKGRARSVVRCREHAGTAHAEQPPTNVPGAGTGLGVTVGDKDTDTRNRSKILYWVSVLSVPEFLCCQLWPRAL